MTFTTGDTIVAQGDPSNAFFIVTEGTVTVWRKDPDLNSSPRPPSVDMDNAVEEKGNLLAQLPVWSHFGE